VDGGENRREKSAMSEDPQGSSHLNPGEPGSTVASASAIPLSFALILLV